MEIPKENLSAQRHKKFHNKIAQNTKLEEKFRFSFFVIVFVIIFVIIFSPFLIVFPSYCFNPTTTKLESAEFQNFPKSFLHFMRLCNINTAPITISSKIEKVWRLRNYNNPFQLNPRMKFSNFITLAARLMWSESIFTAERFAFLFFKCLYDFFMCVWFSCV